MNDQVQRAARKDMNNTNDVDRRSAGTPCYASLSLSPIDLEAANIFVKKLHRHHNPVPGCRFCIAVTDCSAIRGVVIVGRPVARALDDGWTLEVNRCCTDGVSNGCSMLYGAARRTAQSMGYRRIITYTLPEEGGASLKASGWKHCGEAGGGKWTNNTRQRKDDHPLQAKWLWECVLRTDQIAVDWRQLKHRDTVQQPTLFDA